MAKNKIRAQMIVSVPIIIFILIVVLLFIRLGENETQNASILIGKSVPNTTLPPIEGMEILAVKQTDFQNRQKITIVNFWASWCVPCRAEHPLLMQLANIKNIHLIGINYKDKPENAKQFLKELGNPFWRIGADRNGRTAIDWGVYGIPETFIIDINGTIQYKHVGPITGQYWPKILSEIKKIMQKQKKQK